MKLRIARKMAKRGWSHYNARQREQAMVSCKRSWKRAARRVYRGRDAAGPAVLVIRVVDRTAGIAALSAAVRDGGA